MGDFLDDTILPPSENEVRKVRSVIRILKLRAKDTQCRNEVIGFLECLAEEMQMKVDETS